jgi:hypothetical protein
MVKKDYISLLLIHPPLSNPRRPSHWPGPEVEVGLTP